MKRHKWIGICLLGLLMLGRAALAQSGGGYDLSWWTIDGGGASFIQSNNFTLGCTVGQPDASSDALTGGNYTLYVGFWVPVCTAGDVNCDGCVDDADLLAVLFDFGCSSGCGAEDVNGDGTVDDADLLIVLFNFGQGC